MSGYLIRSTAELNHKEGYGKLFGLIHNLLLYKKKVREKINFIKILKGCYFLLGGCTDIILGLY